MSEWKLFQSVPTTLLLDMKRAWWWPFGPRYRVEEKEITITFHYKGECPKVQVGGVKLEARK